MYRYRFYNTKKQTKKFEQLMYVLFTKVTVHYMFPQNNIKQTVKNFQESHKKTHYYVSNEI